MNKIIIILFFISGLAFAEDLTQPRAPVSPRQPAAPVVSGAPENTGSLRIPALPSPPSINNQSNGQVYEIENYDLTVSEAYPNGDTRNNTANTINNAQYILYSDRTAVLKLFFKNGAEYIYHLRNPRSKIEISSGVFRETFDTVVQVGKEFLLEQYLSELTYNNDTVISLNLIGNNRVYVLVKFTKKM